MLDLCFKCCSMCKPCRRCARDPNLPSYTEKTIEGIPSIVLPIVRIAGPTYMGPDASLLFDKDLVAQAHLPPGIDFQYLYLDMITFCDDVLNLFDASMSHFRDME